MYFNSLRYRDTTTLPAALFSEKKYIHIFTVTDQELHCASPAALEAHLWRRAQRDLRTRMEDIRLVTSQEPAIVRRERMDAIGKKDYRG